MLSYWQNFEMPGGSTLAAWGMIAVLSLAAVALSFWLRRRFGR
jgi:Mg2+ and Co2+ transporter CorA